MAVRIRLQRFGKKKQPVYRVVVMDGRKPRDGRYIESIGRYDPRQEPSLIDIDGDRALEWLAKGAQPSETVRKLMEVSGVWSRFKVAKGQIHTVDSTQVAPQSTEPAAVEAAPDVQVEVGEPADGEGET